MAAIENDVNGHKLLVYNVMKKVNKYMKETMEINCAKTL